MLNALRLFVMDEFNLNHYCPVYSEIYGAGLLIEGSISLGCSLYFKYHQLWTQQIYGYPQDRLEREITASKQRIEKGAEHLMYAKYAAISTAIVILSKDVLTLMNVLNVQNVDYCLK